MKKSIIALILLTVSLGAISLCQTMKSADISTVAAAGAVAGHRYTNSYFELTVDARNATLALNPLVDAAGERARLLTVKSDTYTFAVLSDTLTKYPQLQSPAQYVRSVRHQLEKDGFPPVRAEFPVKFAGVEFTGAVLQVLDPSGRKHSRGIYSTFRNGYILSFDVEALMEDQLSSIVTRLVKFTN